MRESGIRDLVVLRALEAVQRRDFLPADLRPYVNRNIALPIEAGRFCPSPLAAARMLVAAAIDRGLHVLEIGTGSGFVTALLAHLAGATTTLERHRELAEAARRRFARLGLGGITVETPSNWHNGPACFDRIVAPAGFDKVPAEVWRRLAPNGMLVYGRSDPLRPSHPILVAARRARDGAVIEADHGSIRLPPGSTDDWPVN